MDALEGNSPMHSCLPPSACARQSHHGIPGVGFSCLTWVLRHLSCLKIPHVLHSCLSEGHIFPIGLVLYLPAPQDISAQTTQWLKHQTVQLKCFCHRTWKGADSHRQHPIPLYSRILLKSTIASEKNF